MSNLQNRIRRDLSHVTSAVNLRVTKCLYVRLVHRASTHGEGVKAVDVLVRAGDQDLVVILGIRPAGEECQDVPADLRR